MYIKQRQKKKRQWKKFTKRQKDNKRTKKETDTNRAREEDTIKKISYVKIRIMQSKI